MTTHKRYRMRDQTENGNMHRKIEKSNVFFFFKMMCVSVEANMNAKRLWEAIRILREMSDDILT